MLSRHFARWRRAGLAAWLLGASTAGAAGPLDLSRVPLEAEAPEKFIPPGWKLEESARGDLNGDGREDVVLGLAEVLTPAEEKSEVSSRAVLVLLAEPGKWRRAAASNKVLDCVGCTAALGGEGGMVRVEKGVLVLTQIDTDDHREFVLRLRHDPKDGRFVFIGDDVWEEAQGGDQGLSVSTLPLQGRKVTERVRYKQGKRIVLSTKKAKVPVRRRFLEDLDVKDYR